MLRIVSLQLCLHASCPVLSFVKMPKHAMLRVQLVLHRLSRVGCFTCVVWFASCMCPAMCSSFLFQPSAVIRFAHVSTPLGSGVVDASHLSLVCMCIHLSADSGEETPLGGFSPSGAFLISYANYKYPRTHYICRAFNFCL